MLADPNRSLRKPMRTRREGEIRVALDPDPRAVRAALGSVTNRLASAGIGPDVRAEVELVLGEVLNNVVEHAFSDGRTGRVSVVLRTDGARLRCEVRDDGGQMPEGRLPRGHLPQDAPSPDELPEGGFGWFLIRSLAADISYRRVAGANRMRFTLRIGAG
jgi:serine/threonine-protein kinase RsbW